MSFRKEISISTQAPLGKKDLKELRKDVAETFPRLTAQQLDAILPLDAEWLVLKAKQSGTVLYQQVGRPPAFFDLEGRGDVWPSIFTVWALPDMMESVETHGPVSKPLLKGADLMLPGVIVPPSGLPSFGAGAKMCVRVAGNPAPIAVGAMDLSSADALAGGMKGKAMRVAHVYRDSLWSYGGRTVPNAGFGPEEVSECKDTPTASNVSGVIAAVSTLAVADDEDPSDDEAAPPDAPGAQGGAPPAQGSDGASVSAPTSEAAVVERLSALSMDELLLETFLNAIASTLSDEKALPIDAADFYQKHMQLAKPAAVTLDAKRSTFKQVAKFFKAQQKAKLITTKEHKGEIKVTAIDLKAELIANHVPSWPLARSAAPGPGAPDGQQGLGGGNELELELAAVARSNPPRVSEMVGATHYLEKLFAACGQSKSALLSRDEAFERVLFAYIDRQRLEVTAESKAAAAAGGAAEQDDWEKEAEAADAGEGGGGGGGGEVGEVALDELLVESLWKVAGGKKKGEEYPTHAPMEECESRFEARLQLWHRVEVDGFEPRERKGPLPHVLISAGRAAGHNKTTVTGLESFRIDPDELARYGKRLFNCTASVAPLPGKFVHEKEVTLQGHCISEMVDHLLKVYKLPKNLIEVKR